MDFDTDSEDEDQGPLPKIYRKRQYYELENLHEKFRLNRQQLQRLLETVGPFIESETGRNHALNSTDKLLITLRFYASGGFYNLIGDAQGPSKSSVCRSIHEVTKAINIQMFQDSIKFPDNLSN